MKTRRTKTKENVIDLTSMTREELEQYAAALETEKSELTAKLSWYEEQFRLSRQKRFGASSGKSDLQQLSFFNEAESEQDENRPEPEMTDLQPRRKQMGKKQKEKITKKLPKQVIGYRLTVGEQICPKCGNRLHEMKKEVRKELTVLPVRVTVTENVAYSYACRNCENTGIEATIHKAPSLVPMFRTGRGI